jgi:hypothetical protein
MHPIAVIEGDARRDAGSRGALMAVGVTASLGNYFVSSTGGGVFQILEEALAASAEEKQDAVLH